MKTTKTIIALLMMMNILLGQQASISDFGFYQFNTSDGGTMPYRMMKPFQYDSLRTEKYPVFIWLHPNGRQGTNNTNQMNDGWSNHLMDSAMRATYPAFVIAPQCKPGIQWATGIYSNNAVHLVDSLKDIEQIDTNRIYIMGWSLGSYGIWRKLREPVALHYYAAAVPIAGAWKPNEWFLPEHYDGIIWAAHGTNDNTVPVGNTRKCIATIRDGGKRAIYSEFPVGHGSHDETMAEDGIWTWIFSQNKAGGNLPNSPQNVQITINGSTAELAWEAPTISSSVDSIMYYNIYKNGIKISTAIEDLTDSTGTGITELTRTTSFSDPNYISGDEYEVKSVNYRNQESVEEITTSILYNEKETKLSIFPIPSSDRISLKNLNHSNSYFEIYSMTGKLIQTGHTNNEFIDISTINSGIYLLQINNQSFKIIKE